MKHVRAVQSAACAGTLVLAGVFGLALGAAPLPQLAGRHRPPPQARCGDFHSGDIDVGTRQRRGGTTPSGTTARSHAKSSRPTWPTQDVLHPHSSVKTCAGTVKPRCWPS